MFPIGAVIWDSTACDIKHGHDGYFATEDLTVEDFGGTFLPKKGGQRQLFCKSQGVDLHRNKGKLSKHLTK